MLPQKRQTELFCDWLDNYLDYERIKKKGEFSLKTMEYLVERFHHPEQAFKSVHIAGSKGKGSISTMVASILGEYGMPSGLYTSPHLLDFTERVSSSSGIFTDELYGKSADIVVPLIESIIPGSIPGGLEPSWFELVTLFAFVTFKEACLPWAVIETGLGGRLDATNVLKPEASIITPIELEHTEYLGDTIAKIAFEKAGIIKEKVPVFLAEQRPEARSVFEAKSKELNAPLFCMEEAIQSISATTSIYGLDVKLTFNDLAGGAHFARSIATRLSLINEIQASNAALAAYTVKYLFPECPEKIIERGLARAWLPGRFEIIQGPSPIILDGAHTIRSVTLTLETFSSLFSGDAHLVFACAADKAVDEMASLFKGHFSRITVTRPGNKKQSDIIHAETAFTGVFGTPDGKFLIIDNDYETAISQSILEAERKGVPLLVTGSFYLVAETKKILERLKRDRES